LKYKDFIPHVTVATVIENDGKFLLVEELANGKAVYNQPAGHLDANESLEQAALRETLEETGWDIALRGVVGLSLYTAPSNGVTYIRTTFFASAVRHNEDQALDKGIIQAVWLTLDEMRAASDRMRSPLVIATVEQYIKGARYPLELIFRAP
jgi:8-oxo-dGTP pyrophosphatase MutT (NUDIX family)